MTSLVTVESVCLLGVEERRGPPDAHRAVVRGRGQEAGDGGVPAYTVDGARVARQLGDGQLTAPVPDVHLVVWAEERKGWNGDRIRRRERGSEEQDG